jgi:hypothetical protein
LRFRGKAVLKAFSGEEPFSIGSHEREAG